MRWTIYRKLNAVTTQFTLPLPRLEDVFDTIGTSQAKLFSTLDLASGFWQIPMDNETKHKSAFVTPSGVYQWKRMPFGLVNAPASFQAIMTQVLRGLNWKSCLVYVDDIRFRSTKTALTISPVLAYPDHNKPFTLTTDGADQQWVTFLDKLILVEKKE